MTVNGEKVELKKAMTLKQFLEEQGYRAQHVVTERNGEIVPLAQADEVMLENRDVLEIIAFVGGG